MSHGPPRGNNSMAVAAMVCGVGSWIGLPIIASIAGIICGHMARKQIKQTGEEGDQLAVVGLVLSYANIILGCISIAVVIAMFTLGLGFFGIAAAANQ